MPRLRRKLGYSLQSARKTLDGKQHPDRERQVAHINKKVGDAIVAGQPAISIDTKKKELVGEFKNAGPSGIPRAARPRPTPTTSASMASADALMICACCL